MERPASAMHGANFSRKRNESPEPSISSVDGTRSDESVERRKRLGKELCEAAAEGLLDEIKGLVKAGASINATDYDKRSPMHLACSEGHIEVVKFLIDSGADINCVDRWGGYPLMDAIRGKHYAIKDLLSSHGAKLSEEDVVKLGQEICLASAQGDLGKLQNLVTVGANVNSFDWDRRSALHLASAEGHFELVEFLLAHKADPNCKDRWGADPLKDAQRGKHLRVQQVLKEAGAIGDSDEHSDHGQTMGERMCASASKGDLKEIRLLVAQRASINAADYDKRSAMHLAAAEGHHDVVKFLVEQGATVNAQDRWGGDPLKDAIRGGHSECQSILRAAGGRGTHDDHSDHRDHGDRMCNAASKGDLALVTNLVTKGASVNAADYDGRSALHLAAAEGHDKIVQFLVANKADVHFKDRWGGNALKDAVRSGHRKVQAILLEAGAGDGGETVDHVKEQLDLDQYSHKPLHVKARAENWAVDRSEIKMGDLLGEGQQGFVMRGDWRGMPVVCKVIKNTNSKADELDFQNEISVLSHLRHPSLVLFLGACVDGEPKIIISEYLSGGSLEDVYNKKHHERGGKSWRPPTQTIHMWALELARALNFLHKCVPCILHRDLKPGNLLLTQEGHLKVSDFGLSKIVDKTTNGAYVMTGVTGTLRYMAPEVMRSEAYNEKVDIYSFAMVLWFMCTGERPLLGANQKTFLDAAARHEYLRPDLKPITFKPIADLMEKCWAAKPTDRLPADKIVEWLSEMQLPSNPKKKASTALHGDKCSVQ